MKVASPDYRDRRAESVLLVWGDIPFWMVVDLQAARFIDALCAGESRTAALRAAADGKVDRGLERAGDAILRELKKAGVAGGKRPSPPAERIESITVNVTNRCPLQCRFCYNQARDVEDEGEISADVMIEALESVRRWIAPGAVLALLGGEPLLEKEKTLVLAEWGRANGLRPIVSTNGLLIDADFAARAARARLECQVSIDGADAGTHDAVRGPGTFAQACAGAETLIAHGAYTILSMVLYHRNEAEVIPYLRMAHEMGAHEARFIPIKKVGHGTPFGPPHLSRIVREVAFAVTREPHLGRLLGRDYVSILAHTCRSCSPRQSCGTACQTFLLDADGTIYPCPNLANVELAAGVVTREPLDRIWRHSEGLARVRAQTRIAARTGGCAGCFVRHWCLGGCRGETYENLGRLDAPSPNCRENKAAILEMFWTLSRHPDLVRLGPKHC